MFWFKTIRNLQDEVYYLGEKLIKIQNDLKNVDTMELERLKSHMLSLRGLVNRKIGKLELEDDEEEEKKDPRDKVLVPVKD